MQENTNNGNRKSNNEKNNMINGLNNIKYVDYTKNNSFLGKKKKLKMNQEIYIDNIRRLIVESGIDKNFLKDKLFPQNSNEEVDKINTKQEIKKVKKFKCENDNNNQSNHLQQTNSLREWYKKINFLPEEYQEIKEIILDEDDYNQFDKLNWAKDETKENNNIIQESQDGKIFFNGIKNSSIAYPHYIFLKNSYKFNISVENRRYSWKIKFLSTSHLIGIGLAYQNIVQKNNNKFLDENEPDFNNGIFALIQTYNPIIKKYCIRPWNCLDKNIANYVADFPSFKKGKEITVSYDTNKERIEFKIKNNIHIMSNVKLNGINYIKDNNNLIMSPCVVFYQKGDEVKFYEFKEDIISNNNKIKSDEEFVNIEES